MVLQVAGFCPAGCGATLFLGEGGRIACISPACPRPDAAAVLLSDSECEHVVQITWAGFTLRHPLRERLDDALMTCRLHEYLANPVAPLPPGRYRVAQGTQQEKMSWTWEKLT